MILPSVQQNGKTPKEYWGKLKVIYDGTDHNFFKEADTINEDIVIRNRETKEEFVLQKDEIIITYATRGMEPLRCLVNSWERYLYSQKEDNIR